MNGTCSNRFDVIVVGGGPAGSVAALRLHELGFRVGLIERETDEETARRSTRVESLTPGLLPILDMLGLRTAFLAQSFARRPPAIVIWGEKRARSTASSEVAFHTERARFDAWLRAQCRQRGIDVMQPYVASRPMHSSTRDWLVTLRKGDTTRKVRARFIIDATGRSTWLANTRSRRLGSPTLALSTTYDVPLLDRGCIEAGERCWFWGMPRADHRFDATVFVDSKDVRQQSGVPLKALFQELLSTSRLLHALAEPTLDNDVQVCDATCRVTDQLIGDDWCRIGESAFSFDPISSQGVQAAISTAIRAAAVVNTILRRPTDALVAKAFHENRIAASVQNHLRTSRELYRQQWLACGTDFWQRRSFDNSLASAASHTRDKQSFPTALCMDDRVQTSASVCFVKTELMRDCFIVEGDAVTSHALEAPIAFLGETEVAPILRQLKTRQSVREVLHYHTLSALPVNRRMDLLGRMVALGMLESDDPLQNQKHEFSTTALRSKHPQAT